MSPVLSDSALPNRGAFAAVHRLAIQRVDLAGGEQLLEDLFRAVGGAVVDADDLLRNRRRMRLRSTMISIVSRSL